MTRSSKGRVAALLVAAGIAGAACSDPPAPGKDAAASAAPKATATVAPTASVSAAPPPSAAPAPSAALTASAAPSASASAPAAPLIPAEAPSAEAPTAEEFAAHEKEIAVKASSEQKCSTKVLKGWFEMICGPADGLVRATKVDVLSGFEASKATLDTPEELVSMRWVAALPASGERSQARFWGRKLDDIFLTLEHDAKGWKGAFTADRPE